MKPFEAMAMEIPVMVSDLPALVEIDWNCTPVAWCTAEKVSLVSDGSSPVPTTAPCPRHQAWPPAVSAQIATPWRLTEISVNATPDGCSRV